MSNRLSHIRNLTPLAIAAAALSMLVLAVASGVMQAAAQSQSKLTVNQVNGRAWPDVTVNLTLLGPDGKAIPDVQISRFQVLEEAKPQNITGLELGQSKSVPLDIVLAIDVSGSMSGDKLAQAKAAAVAFVASIRPEDKATILAFSDRLNVVVPATNDRAALQAGLEGLQAAGNTAAYDALYRSAQLLSASPEGHRRAVILLTDGADTTSKYSARVAADVARQQGVLVYTIGLGPDAVDAVLKDLSEPTGGKYYKAPAPQDLQGIYQAISLELSSQLILKYHSTTRTERSYQLVSVQINYGDAQGQILSAVVRYRPPPAALLPSTPETVKVIPTPFFVGLPAGMTASDPTPSERPVSEPDNAFRLILIIGAILAAVAALLFVAAFGTAFWPSPASRRLSRYIGPTAAIADDQQRPPGFFARVIVPLANGLGRRLARISPKGYVDYIQNLLLLTGPPYRVQLGGFLAIQFFLALLFGASLLYWGLRVVPDQPVRWILVCIFGVVLGVYLPYFWLARKVTRRRKELQRALPGALDFLAINVEAGMGFDAAMAQVTQRWHNAFTDELTLLLIDFQIGKPRKDAWRDLIQRTQLPDLSSFVTAMLQNEQVGGSIGGLLRTQAEYMRLRRRQRAEETARVAPVKMLLPMVFFIFPGILVVILGPAIPQFLDAFGNLGR
jgi:tight adherence protein C